MSVHYNGDDSYFFVNNIQQYKFKAKDSEIKTRKLCLGGFSSDSSLSDFTAISKIYHFSVDYQLATTDKIQKLHKYLRRNITYKMSYVPKYLSESSSIKHVTVDLQLEGVGTKKDIEGITHVDTSSFALKTNLSAIKTEFDKLDIPKLGTLPTDVAKLSNKVANDLVEKTDFNSLKTKVDNNETDNGNLEIKVTNNDLTTKTSINNLKTKINGIDLTKYVKKVIMTLKLVI